MTRRVIGPAGTRVGEILEAVETCAVIVFLRILHADKVPFVEAVVNLQVPLVARKSGCASRREVVVLEIVKARRLTVGVWEKQKHFGGYRIDQVTRNAECRLELAAGEIRVS